MSLLDNVVRLRAVFTGNGFDMLNGKLRTTANLANNMKDMFSGFLGINLLNYARDFGRSVIEASKDLGAMRSRFYAITKDEQLANKEMEWSFELAKRTATSVKSVADAYSIFYATARKGLGEENTRQIFTNWTEVSRVLHLSSYQFERVMYAMREMSSKGAIYSQDLRMQIGTHVPGAISLAEKAVNELGITGSNWFETFQEKAKGNQKLINQFLVLFSKYAKQELASPEALQKSLQQTDSAITALQNTWQLFLYNISEGGASQDIIAIIRDVNEGLQWVTDHAKQLYDILKLIFFIVAINKITGISFAIGEIVLRTINLVKYMRLFSTVAPIALAKFRLGMKLTEVEAVALGTTIQVQEALCTLGITLLIQLIIWGIYYIYTHWEELSKGWINIGENIATWWSNLFSDIKSFFGWLGEKLSWIWNNPVIQWLRSLFGGNIDNANITVNASDDIKSLMNANFTKIPNANTYNTTLNRTESLTTLDINVNGKNITNENVVSVIDGMDKNKSKVYDYIINTVKPVQ